MLYPIRLRGCDASTYIVMELNDEEAALVRRIGAASENASENQCMPELFLEDYNRFQHQEA